jgi:hypothetical protein
MKNPTIVLRLIAVAVFAAIALFNVGEAPLTEQTGAIPASAHASSAPQPTPRLSVPFHEQYRNTASEIPEHIQAF